MLCRCERIDGRDGSIVFRAEPERCIKCGHTSREKVVRASTNRLADVLAEMAVDTRRGVIRSKRR